MSDMTEEERNKQREFYTAKMKSLGYTDIEIGAFHATVECHEAFRKMPKVYDNEKNLIAEQIGALQRLVLVRVGIRELTQWKHFFHDWVVDWVADGNDAKPVSKSCRCGAKEPLTSQEIESVLRSDAEYKREMHASQTV